MASDLPAWVRRARMFEQFGRPVRIDAAEALALAGITAVEPEGVVAFRYASREAADAFAAANVEYHGNASLAIVDTDDGPIGITDLRPQLATMGVGA